MKLKEKLRIKRKKILEIASKYGAKDVRVFGSVARGDEKPGSDVDFLIDMEPGRSLLDLGGLLIELEDLLECKIDLVTERGLNELLREEVLKEAVNL